MKSNLTLNLGIRLEQETGMTERYGRMVNGFNTTTPNPIAPTAQAAYASNYATYQTDCAANSFYCPAAPNAFAVKGGLTFASPSNPFVYPASSPHISPRIGFSWSPSKFNNKMVVRGGFGIFVAPLFSTGLANINNSGGISSSPIVNQEGFQPKHNISGPEHVSHSHNDTQQPVSTGILQPVGSSQGLATFLGQSVSFLSPTIKNPYSERWEFDIQEQLTPNLLVEIGYIGNRGVHVVIPQTELNFLPRAYLSTSNYRDAADNAVVTALSQSVPNPFKGLNPNGSINGSTVSLSQLLAPYPEFPVDDQWGQFIGRHQWRPHAEQYRRLILVQQLEFPGGEKIQRWTFSDRQLCVLEVHGTGRLPERLRLRTGDSRVAV